MVGILLRKRYKMVFLTIFGLDLKIIWYLVVGTFHTECMGMGNAL